jgi:hypothetical protein
MVPATGTLYLGYAGDCDREWSMDRGSHAASAPEDGAGELLARRLRARQATGVIPGRFHIWVLSTGQIPRPQHRLTPKSVLRVSAAGPECRRSSAASGGQQHGRGVHRGDQRGDEDAAA